MYDFMSSVLTFIIINTIIITFIGSCFHQLWVLGDVFFIWIDESSSHGTYSQRQDRDTLNGILDF